MGLRLVSIGCSSVERHGFTLNALRLVYNLNGGVLLLELFLHLVLGKALQLLRRERGFNQCLLAFLDACSILDRALTNGLVDRRGKNVLAAGLET